MLCERLRNTSETLGDFAMLDLRGRLARKLLSFATEYGRAENDRVRLDIRLSDTDLARFVGGTRETVNRQMKAWEKETVLMRRERDRGIVLIRLDVLRRLAGED